MLNTTSIPGSRVPIVDENKLVTREWYRWFYNTFNLLGDGSNAINLQDLQVGPIDSVTDPSTSTIDSSPPIAQYVQSYQDPQPIQWEPCNWGSSDLTPNIQLGTASSLNYSKGTWVPSITGGTTNPTVTYVNQRGSYTRIGPIVQMEGYVEWSNISGGSGTVLISSPFNYEGSDASGCVSSIGGVTLPSSAVVPSIRGNTGINCFTITGSTSGASSVIASISDLGPSGYICFSMNYIAL